MHSCPDCGQACYCNGDIDDIDAGDKEAAENCIHCLFEEVLDSCELSDDELPAEGAD
jgi:hypothetical protein